jgi:basic membrane protein A
MKFNTISKAVLGGVALAAVMTGTALADPAVIYDLGGKFDRSFNEAAYNGAQAWAEETGGTFLELELQSDAQREQALRRFASQGAQPIVMAGFAWEAALSTIAPEFPDTNFVVIDTVVDQPNVRSVMFDEHTGSALVGALAAMQSESGTIAFVGGMDVPLIRRFHCGYASGARAVNPDIEVIESYTGTTPAAWNDPVTAGELTTAAIDQGADVIFAAAGGSGIGVLQTAADAGVYSIGVDSNQNYLQPGSVLTSMLKRVDLVVQTSFTDAASDDTFEPGRVDLGLSDDGVGYAVDENNEELITDEMAAAVEELKADIIAGDVEIHDYYTDNACPL